jgi:hypothetical protein
MLCAIIRVEFFERACGSAKEAQMRGTIRPILATGIFLIICTGGLQAQGPDSLWHRTYGGATSDYGYSVDEASDGGFVIAGNTHSFGAGGSDFYVVRTDADGDTLWHRAYGSPGSDYARAALQTPDGGFIVVGSSDTSSTGDYDVYLVKTDADGDTMWARYYGYAGGNDRGSDVCRAPDGGYFVAGYTDAFGNGNDGYLVRTDSNGNMLWDAAYGWAGSEYFECVDLTSNGGCILVGATTSSTPPGWDVYVVKTKADGDTLWTRTFGGTGQDYGNAGRETFEGDFIVIGSLETAAKGNEVYLIRLKPDGADRWRRYYGGTSDEMGYGICQIPSDSGYVAVGWTDSYGAGDWDVYLIRTDAGGDTVWAKTYGGSDRDWGWDVGLLHYDELIISGTTRSYGAGNDDVYLLKIEGELAGVIPDDVCGVAPLTVRAWPNPSVSAVTLSFNLPSYADVRLAIYDLSGRKVRCLSLGDCPAGWQVVTWDAMDSNRHPVAPGIYLCNVEAGEYLGSTKLVLLR